MAGEIISERRATSNRNGGRDHPGIPGDFSRNQQRHFTDEFKTEAVALLASSGRPLIQIAGELGISPSMLRNWRNRQGKQNAGPAKPASATPSVPDLAAEISRLRRENDRLRMERDILKNPRGASSRLWR